MKKIKVGIILSSLGYIERGNEVAYTAYIKCFAQNKNLEVFVFGAGKKFNVNNVTYVRTPCLMRHWFNHYPKIKRLHLTHNHDYENMIYSILIIPQLLAHNLDVILFSSYPFLLLPLMIYKRFKNKDVKMVFNSGGGIAFLYSRFFFADTVTATDPVSQKIFSNKFETVCIPAGADTDIFKPQNISRKELGLPADKFIIFSSSAFAPVKRLDFLIKAASQIDNAFLVFSSTGVQEDYLKKIGKEMMGTNVKFLGVISHADLVKYYSVSDVFCLPSKSEPFGLVLVEAMACQTPVVTNDSDIQKWIIGAGGSCVDVMDMDCLIKALEKYKNKEVAQKTGIAGRINVQERFSWAAAAEQYYQLFKELVSNEQ